MSRATCERGIKKVVKLMSKTRKEIRGVKRKEEEIRGRKEK